MQPAFVDVLGHRMAYRRAGRGPDVLFLHGNPTSSVLWADVVADLSDAYRCTAVDLIGMGDSDRLPGTGDARYAVAEHARYLDAAVEALGLDRDVVLVGHDWGGVLAVDRARRFPAWARGLAYLEAGVVPVSWREGTGPDPGLFGALRGPDGERMVLQDNVFVEVVLQAGTQRVLTPAELDAYRRPFAEPGEDRRAMLTWARQIPIDGNPPEVHARVAAGADFLAGSPLPKLLVRGEPGAVVTGAVLEACRRWLRQREVVVTGTHFLPHDSSPAIAAALRAWLEEEVTV